MMFEIGKDICKRGFVGFVNNVKGHKGLIVLYRIVLFFFIIFAGATLWYGIKGPVGERNLNTNGQWQITRADIEDRNGVKLAKNVMSGHIMLRPNAVKNPDDVANFVHDLLPYKYSVTDVLRLLKSGKFLYLKKEATDAEIAAVKNAKLEGLEIELIQKRRYPKHNLFSHIVGFVGRDDKGLEGVEMLFDDYLRENTEPLRLSLDARIQEQFYIQLSYARQKYRAKGAMGMLMNSKTGEMIAMVSLPDFDPENVGAYPVENRRFKPMRDVLEMGSIFKIFNTALAYENGINKRYIVNKPYKMFTSRGKYIATIHDVSSFRPSHPDFTVDEIMLHSCNVGSAQIALDLPMDAQKEFFERLKLDEVLSLDFGKTEKTLMPRQWGIAERATVSFGHGIAVTPVHLLLAVNAVTNGGFYIYPTIQKRELGRIDGQRVLSQEISTKLREIMVGVVEQTSGKKAKIHNIQIGGKTATAEKRFNGKIDKSKNITAFTGIFPAEAPQYILLVVLDEPHATEDSYGWKTAAWNAVPTAGKILDGILPLLFE
ncbi:MAG: peptidoglycan D,D-transpeptidase FtsI family protein [Alphaproteobacteria bacterium]